MDKHTPKVQYKTTDSFSDQIRSGLLVAAYDLAQRSGLFAALEKYIKVKMKTVVYTPLQKLLTLWASLVVGCKHTVEINEKLGADQPAAAALFDMDRFPDQSQENILLRRFNEENVEQFRQAHYETLLENTRGKDPVHWIQLWNGQRLLVVDLDQMGLTVRGKHFELAEAGHFGRKRSRRGYKKSVAFLGGTVQEVLDQYLDPGSAHTKSRFADLIASVTRYITALGLRPQQVLIRGDAQYGTAANCALLQSLGYNYLFKGCNRQQAQKIAQGLPAHTVFYRVTDNQAQLPRWVADAGEHVITEARPSPGEKKQSVRVQVFLLANTREKTVRTTKYKGNRKVHPVKREVVLEHLITNLNRNQLAEATSIQLYDGRATIENYFKDDQYGLLTKHLRTRKFHGIACFLWLAAMVYNQLMWLRHTTFAGTALEKMGVRKLIHSVMQVPARIERTAKKIIVYLPKHNRIVRLLLKAHQQKPPKIHSTVVLAVASG